jgi:hypothetical protein
VDKTGLVTVFPSQVQLTTALRNVIVTAENSSATYDSFVVSGNLTFVPYNWLIKLPFLQMVANTSFGSIESVIKTFFSVGLFSGDASRHVIHCTWSLLTAIIAFNFLN